MLRKIRVALAWIFWIGITLLFLDFTGALHAYLGWMAKAQFLPAVLALNVGVIVALVLLTLVFGRVYCSVICPLGVFQDGISWLGTHRSKKPYHYKKENKWLRYGVWVLFVVALVAGVQAAVALLAPYSAYGRMVQNLLQPIYLWGNNLLAGLAERAGSYAFYEKCGCAACPPSSLPWLRWWLSSPCPSKAAEPTATASARWAPRSASSRALPCSGR